MRSWSQKGLLDALCVVHAVKYGFRCGAVLLSRQCRACGCGCYGYGRAWEWVGGSWSLGPGATHIPFFYKTVTEYPATGYDKVGI